MADSPTAKNASEESSGTLTFGAAPVRAREASAYVRNEHRSVFGASAFVWSYGRPRPATPEASRTDARGPGGAMTPEERRAALRLVMGKLDALNASFDKAECDFRRQRVRYCYEVREIFRRLRAILHGDREEESEEMRGMEEKIESLAEKEQFRSVRELAGSMK